MTSTTTQKTLGCLRELFASYGCPELFVSDNGPQFSSAEFSSFLSSNGVRHVKSPPYHPQSNGAAERCVQTFKGAMKSMHKRRAWRHCYKIATISFPVPLHAACHDWYLASSAVFGAYFAHEVVNVAPGFGRESACQAGEAAELWASRSASI